MSRPAHISLGIVFTALTIAFSCAAPRLVVAPVRGLMTSTNAEEAAAGRVLAVKAAVAIRQSGLLQQLQYEMSMASTQMEVTHKAFLPFLEVGDVVGAGPGVSAAGATW